MVKILERIFGGEGKGHTKVSFIQMLYEWFGPYEKLVGADWDRPPSNADLTPPYLKRAQRDAVELVSRCHVVTGVPSSNARLEVPALKPDSLVWASVDGDFAEGVTLADVPLTGGCEYNREGLTWARHLPEQHIKARKVTAFLRAVALKARATALSKCPITACRSKHAEGSVHLVRPAMRDCSNCESHVWNGKCAHEDAAAIFHHQLGSLLDVLPRLQTCTVPQAQLNDYLVDDTTPINLVDGFAPIQLRPHPDSLLKSIGLLTMGPSVDVACLRFAILQVPHPYLLTCARPRS